jgi:UDP-N-acetylmuramyl pentapeptide phosphotransferase/UDP-N-acetylglucosamine-1-phosphate transferase
MSTSLLFLVLIAAEWGYFKLAYKYTIVDKPNARSSHSQTTIRGGGIVFPLAVLLSFAVGELSWTIALAVGLVALVSFIDDIKPLPALPRFGVQLAALALLAYELNLVQEPVWMLVIIGVGLIGWINAFNFMDGINGITVLYSGISLLSLGYVNSHTPVFQSIVIVGMAAVVFGFVNLRKKALAFSGDVGSISLAVFLAYVLLYTMFTTQQWGFLLFFAVYGIDSASTILIRLAKKENIFQAHRTHLYQYLANEKKWSHLKVSAFYAAAQALINGVVWVLHQRQLLTTAVILSIGILLGVVYFYIRLQVITSLNSAK